MSDLKDRIYEILKGLQLASFATVTGDGKPWVRYVMIRGAEDFTIRLATFVKARKVTQIQKNAEVHLTCGITDPQMMAPYLQIQGKARLTIDEAERHRFWFDKLSGIFKGPDDANYGIIIVKPYRIEYCSADPHQSEVWTAG
ncbi:MAG TPA: pyridoxamine 5'-phosphate oxidase family protein [Planctomycetes bacterium]|nr:pyridoxamine 5'-phosphate oxidase family protein [Planctomycetota bacterium]